MGAIPTPRFDPDAPWECQIEPEGWNFYWLTLRRGPGTAEGGYHVLGRKRAEKKARRIIARLNRQEERRAQRWTVGPDA